MARRRVVDAVTQARALRTELLPDEAAICAVTLAELELGIHLAASETIRARRLATLRSLQATYLALPIVEEVASAFAELVAAARGAGRRPKVQDCCIAATARAHGVPVYTQDRDFDELPGIDVVRVCRRGQRALFRSLRSPWFALCRPSAGRGARPRYVWSFGTFARRRWCPKRVGGPVDRPPFGSDRRAVAAYEAVDAAVRWRPARKPRRVSRRSRARSGSHSCSRRALQFGEALAAITRHRLGLGLASIAWMGSRGQEGVNRGLHGNGRTSCPPRHSDDCTAGADEPARSGPPAGT